jgi:hypothetical protein
MPLRSASSPALPPMPDLSDAEWRDVQRALHEVCDDARANRGALARSGPRGLLRIGRIFPTSRQAAPGVAPQVQSLKDFLHARVRHGVARDRLASQLEQHGFSPAQIAALELIAG